MKRVPEAETTADVALVEFEACNSSNTRSDDIALDDRLLFASGDTTKPTTPSVPAKRRPEVELDSWFNCDSKQHKHNKTCTHINMQYVRTNS